MLLMLPKMYTMNTMSFVQPGLKTMQLSQYNAMIDHVGRISIWKYSKSSVLKSFIGIQFERYIGLLPSKHRTLKIHTPGQKRLQTALS